MSRATRRRDTTSTTTTAAAVAAVAVATDDNDASDRTDGKYIKADLGRAAPRLSRVSPRTTYDFRCPCVVPTVHQRRTATLSLPWMFPRSPKTAST